MFYYLQVANLTCPTLDSVLEKPEPITTQNVNTLYTSANTPSPAWQWYFNGNLIPGATNLTYVITQAGCYQVTASEAGCTGISDTVCTTVGLHDQMAEAHLSVFPNRFESTITVNGEPVSPVSIDFSLCSALGQTVWQGGSKLVGKGQQDIILAPKELAPGTYFLVLQSNGWIKTIPLLRL